MIYCTHHGHAPIVHISMTRAPRRRRMFVKCAKVQVHWNKVTVSILLLLLDILCLSSVTNAIKPIARYNAFSSLSFPILFNCCLFILYKSISKQTLVQCLSFLLCTAFFFPSENIIHSNLFQINMSSANDDIEQSSADSHQTPHPTDISSTKDLIEPTLMNLLPAGNISILIRLAFWLDCYRWTSRVEWKCWNSFKYWGCTTTGVRWTWYRLDCRSR